MTDIKETLIDLLTGYSLDTYEDVQYVADELIAKGVLPVVRCKDCKHYYRPLQWPVEYTKGLCDVDLFERRVHPDDFCSYGERKEADRDG